MRLSSACELAMSAHSTHNSRRNSGGCKLGGFIRRTEQVIRDIGKSKNSYLVDRISSPRPVSSLSSVCAAAIMQCAYRAVACISLTSGQECGDTLLAFPSDMCRAGCLGSSHTVRVSTLSIPIRRKRYVCPLVSPESRFTRLIQSMDTRPPSHAHFDVPIGLAPYLGRRLALPHASACG